MNVTSDAIEIHFGSGTVTVPPWGAVPVAPVQAADRAIQKLLQRGVVRLAGQESGERPTGEGRQSGWKKGCT